VGNGPYMDSPFLRSDHPGYPEILTDATIHVLGARGIDRWSIRALARWMKVTPAAVLNDYTRARVLEIVIICFERRWLAWSASESMFGSSPTELPLRLPATQDEQLGVRVHSALQLLAEAERLRGNPAPTMHLERLRREEKELLRHRLEQLARHRGLRRPGEGVVGSTMAQVTGLRSALADPADDLTWSAACAALREHVKRGLDDVGPVEAAS